MIPCFPHPMMGRTPPAYFVAAGVQASSVSIPVSTSGAQVGDLILYFSPHTGIGPTPGGSGWAIFSNAYNAGGYTSYVYWKVLSSTADVTVSEGSYGHGYAIYRGPKMAVQNAFTSASASITAAAPAANALALLIIGSDDAVNSPATPPTGFALRSSAHPSGAVTIDILDTLNISAPTGGAKALSGYPTDATSSLIAIELRL
jgi:hypothetical protein